MSGIRGHGSARTGDGSWPYGEEPVGATNDTPPPTWVNATDVRAWLTYAGRQAEYMATLDKYRDRPGNLRDQLLVIMAAGAAPVRLSAADDVRLQALLAARFGQPFGVADVAPMLRALAQEIR